MRPIDADKLQLAIVEEGQANKRKKYNIGDIWELTGAEIREVINSQPTIQPEIIYCNDCKHNYGLMHGGEFNPEDIVCTYFDTDGMQCYDFCSYAERI